jgi:hypothetical protein
MRIGAGQAAEVGAVPGPGAGDEKVHRAGLRGLSRDSNQSEHGDEGSVLEEHFALLLGDPQAAIGYWLLAISKSQKPIADSR